MRDPLVRLGLAVAVLGLVLAVIGLFLPVAGRYLGWLGRLPGDVNVERGGVRIHIPVVTCILISVVLTLVLNCLLRR